MAEATQKLSEQTARNEQLTQDRDALQTRLRQWDAEVEAAAVLRAENELLKRQLADARAAASREDTEQALKQAQARIAALQSDLEILRLEKATLENRLSTMAAATPAPLPPSGMSNVCGNWNANGTNCKSNLLPSPGTDRSPG